MSRRIITAEDVQRMEPGERLLVDDAVTLTAVARDLAGRRGVVVVEDADVADARPTSGDDAAALPTPDAVARSVSGPVEGRPGRIIVTSVGVNRPGILSEVTAAIGRLGGDIQDVSQLIRGGYFHAILIVDISGSGQSFAVYRDALIQVSEPTDYVVTVIDERVFHAMHRL